MLVLGRMKMSHTPPTPNSYASYSEDEMSYLNSNIEKYRKASVSFYKVPKDLQFHFRLHKSEDYCLPGCDTIHSNEWLLKFRRNLSPLSSG